MQIIIIDGHQTPHYHDCTLAHGKQRYIFMILEEVDGVDVPAAHGSTRAKQPWVSNLLRDGVLLGLSTQKMHNKAPQSCQDRRSISR